MVKDCLGCGLRKNSPIIRSPQRKRSSSPVGMPWRNAGRLRAIGPRELSAAALWPDLAGAGGGTPFAEGTAPPARGAWAGGGGGGGGGGGRGQRGAAAGRRRSVVGARQRQRV